MKITITVPDGHGDQAIPVEVNPKGQHQGRPNAGLTYEVTVRRAYDGDVRLVAGTEFAPPCYVATLPRFSLPLARGVLTALGLVGDVDWVGSDSGVDAPARVDAMTTFAIPTARELVFLKAFGFTPGARFDLALPMLRFARAELRVAQAEPVPAETPGDGGDVLACGDRDYNFPGNTCAKPSGHDGWHAVVGSAPWRRVDDARRPVDVPDPFSADEINRAFADLGAATRDEG